MRMSAEQERGGRRGEEPGAFDLWVRRVLQEHYGRVVHEPVPEDLLRLLSTSSPEQ